MKIIVPGIVSPDWTRLIDCEDEEGCDAALEVGLTDLYTERVEDFGRGQTLAFCRCPCCGIRIEVDRVTEYIVGLPTAEAWEAANPELVAALNEARRKAEAMRKTADETYGEISRNS